MSTGPSGAIDLTTLAATDTLACQIVMRARATILTRPRNNEELASFYRIPRELNDYAGRITSRIQVKVREEKDRLLRQANHTDERRLFWENWDFFMVYLNVHRAYLAFTGVYHEMAEPAYAPTTLGWEGYLPELISFGRLLHSKVAPPGSSDAAKAKADLWHIDDYACLGTSMNAPTYFLLTLAPPSGDEIKQLGLEDLVADAGDGSDWLNGMGDAETGGVWWFAREFQLEQGENPYLRD
ncbi:MAG: hypothetical protein L6R42_000528 [Xanthoria sp. 1 TBL-2021]|nr:MAG: hypothetical protein L6R42_000528 [Xanthoria sp. 1 TBL-2021]